MKETELKPYKCKHFKWTSWTHYGSKMYEYACKLKGGIIALVKGAVRSLKERIDNE